MYLRSRKVCPRCNSRHSDEQHRRPGTNVSIVPMVLVGCSHFCLNMAVLYNCNTQSWYVPLIEHPSDIFIKGRVCMRHDLETGFSVLKAFRWTSIMRICEIWSSGERRHWHGALSLRRAAGTRVYP